MLSLSLPLYLEEEMWLQGELSLACSLSLPLYLEEEMWLQGELSLSCSLSVSLSLWRRRCGCRVSSLSHSLCMVGATGGGDAAPGYHYYMTYMTHYYG